MAAINSLACRLSWKRQEHKSCSWLCLSACSFVRQTASSQPEAAYAYAGRPASQPASQPAKPVKNVIRHYFGPKESHWQRGRQVARKTGPQNVSLIVFASNCQLPVNRGRLPLRKLGATMRLCARARRKPARYKPNGRAREACRPRSPQESGPQLARARPLAAQPDRFALADRIWSAKLACNWQQSTGEGIGSRMSGVRVGGLDRVDASNVAQPPTLVVFRV